MKTTLLRFLAGLQIVFATFSASSQALTNLTYVKGVYPRSSETSEPEVKLVSALRDGEKALVTTKLSGIDKLLRSLPPGSKLHELNLFVAPLYAQTMAQLENVKVTEQNLEQGYLIVSGEIPIATLESITFKGDQSAHIPGCDRPIVINFDSIGTGDQILPPDEKSFDQQGYLLGSDSEQSPGRGQIQLTIHRSGNDNPTDRLWVIYAFLSFIDPDGNIYVCSGTSQPFTFGYGFTLGILAGFSIAYHFSGKLTQRKAFEISEALKHPSSVRRNYDPPSSERLRTMVFISYSWEGAVHTAWAMKLAAELESRGYEVLLDQKDAGPGKNFARFMLKGEVDPIVWTTKRRN